MHQPTKLLSKKEAALLRQPLLNENDKYQK